MLSQRQRNILDTALGVIEDTIISPFINLRSIDPEPIFIIGAPRSGTTVFYQWFVHYLETNFSYLSRVGDLFPSASLSANWVGYKLFGKDLDISKVSEYGQIKGYMALSEGNRVWHRYLKSTSDYVSPESISHKELRFLTKVVKKHCYFFNSLIFINKSPHNSLRVNYLKTIFPRSKFIVLIRDGRDVSKSLLNARNHFYGRPDKWWSVKPNNWNDIDILQPHIACAKQWQSITSDMLNQINTLDINSHITLRYEDFLNQPFVELKKCYEKFDLRYSKNKELTNLSHPTSYKSYFSEEEISEINGAIYETLNQFDYI
ncbi:MAG: sulfotransferase [Bacteroidetes bacterium]|nr:sulfotransferase [Bacteroidota bacterium]